MNDVKPLEMLLGIAIIFGLIFAAYAWIETIKWIWFRIRPERDWRRELPNAPCPHPDDEFDGKLSPKWSAYSPPPNFVSQRTERCYVARVGNVWFRFRLDVDAVALDKSHNGDEWLELYSERY